MIVSHFFWPTNQIVTCALADVRKNLSVYNNNDAIRRKSSQL